MPELADKPSWAAMVLTAAGVLLTAGVAWGLLRAEVSDIRGDLLRLEVEVREVGDHLHSVDVRLVRFEERLEDGGRTSPAGRYHRQPGDEGGP